MDKYIYIIMAQSGVGKTSVVEYLEENYKLKSIQSYTTRKPRYNGEKGHTFVNQAEFNSLKDMVAYTYFDEHEYCATTQQVNDNDLYILDTDGVEFFNEKYKGEKIPIVIHLCADLVTRMQRMRGRGDTKEKIIQRVENDRVKFSNLKYDYKVNTENKSIEQVAEEVYQIIKNNN